MWGLLSRKNHYCRHVYRGQDRWDTVNASVRWLHAAAFVSHAAQRTKGDLEKIDLLPRIRHKILITPELASVFRGDKKELIPSFSKITRVLDGEGLWTDSGTHGGRGYKGDYVFAWLGCTTPFDNNVWETMAQLGSRLFFLMLETNGDMNEDALVASLLEDDPYKARREACRAVVSPFLGELFSQHGGVRSVVWNPSKDDPEAQRWVARLPYCSRIREACGER